MLNANLMHETFPLLGIFGVISDVDLILKIFVMLTIISFVKNHIEDQRLAVIVMAIMGYAILFDLWRLFLPFYGLYMLFAFGVMGIFVDLFFAHGVLPSPQQQMQGQEAGENQESGAQEMQHRMHLLHKAQRSFFRHPPRGR